MNSFISGFLSLLPTLGLGTIIGTLFGYWFKDKLDQNAENRRKIRDEKEKQYKAFLNNLLGFFEKWKDDALQLQFMWEVYTNAAVYASDEALRLAYSYIKSFDKTNTVSDSKRQNIYAKLVITIRNELDEITGGSKSKLSEDEIQIMGLDNVKEDIKKQFMQNLHKEIKL